MGKLPVPLSPVINAQWHSEFILAKLKDARRLCGLPVSLETSTFVGLKRPLQRTYTAHESALSPFLTDRRNLTFPTSSFLSIYCSGRTGRLVVPLRCITQIAILEESALNKQMEGKNSALGSPLPHISSYRAQHRPEPRQLSDHLLQPLWSPCRTILYLSAPPSPGTSNPSRMLFSAGR